jgi:Ca2+-dependent lipid-binding protein
LTNPKTTVIRKNLHPTWNHTIDLPVYLFSQELSFTFLVWDRDSVSPDDFLGKYQISITPTWDQFWKRERRKTGCAPSKENAALHSGILEVPDFV